MNILNYKIRKKYRIQYYSWMRLIMLIFGFISLVMCSTIEQVIAVSFSFATIVALLTMAVDNLTWRRGWRKFGKKRDTIKHNDQSFNLTLVNEDTVKNLKNIK